MEIGDWRWMIDDDDWRWWLIHSSILHSSLIKNLNKIVTIVEYSTVPCRYVNRQWHIADITHHSVLAYVYCTLLMLVGTYDDVQEQYVVCMPCILLRISTYCTIQYVPTYFFCSVLDSRMTSVMYYVLYLKITIEDRAEWRIVLLFAFVSHSGIAIQKQQLL